MKKFTSLLAICTLAMVSIFPIMQGSVAALAPSPWMTFADTPKDAVCNGIGLTGSEGCNNSTAASNHADSLLVSIITIFSRVVGVIAVIMIIVGGLRFILAGGESGKVTGAKNTIIYALIGLIVVALAQLIVHFVLSYAQ